jgi:hypothetical protein
MALKAGEMVKTIEIPVTKQGEGGEVEDVLKVKYRPVTQQWIERWTEAGVREYAAGQQLRALMVEHGEAERALSEATNGHKAELQARVEEAARKLEEHRKANPTPEYDFLSRQMADLLTDVGYLGEDDNPLPVTPENLATVVDRELLEDIKERIEKKLFRRSTT